METHLLFDTNAFNLSEVGEHFINPCCFGQDAVAWFIVQLGALGYWTDLAGQEAGAGMPA